jgi:DNA-directed RNA polymerase omega subunit
MSASQPNSERAEISRFRAVVVAALRAKQLRRGSKPRITLDDKKHKDTVIAVEEVSRGLVIFREFIVPQVHDPNVIGDLKTGVEQSLPAIG